jgi:hypothetical protein
MRQTGRSSWSRRPFIDIDATQKRVYEHRKQGAGFGHTKIQGKSLLVRGLNAVAGTICTPLGAPVIAAVRLRGGNANSASGAATFAAEAIATACDTGCTGTVIVRADSAYYSAAFCGAVRRAGARFSVTVNMDSKVTAAIAAIPDHAWTGIRYPRAIWDDQLGCWVSDAQVAETGYTAFTYAKKGQLVTARLIARRVRDLNKQAPAGQDELFPTWRYHAALSVGALREGSRGVVHGYYLLGLGCGLVGGVADLLGVDHAGARPAKGYGGAVHGAPCAGRGRVDAERHRIPRAAARRRHGIGDSLERILRRGGREGDRLGCFHGDGLLCLGRGLVGVVARLVGVDHAGAWGAERHGGAGDGARRSGRGRIDAERHWISRAAAGCRHGIDVPHRRRRR